MSRRRVGWCGVHDADSFESVGGSLVENRAGPAVVDVLLLEASKAVVRVVDFFADVSGWEEGFVAVVDRSRNVAVAGQDTSGGGQDFVSTFCIAWRGSALSDIRMCPIFIDGTGVSSVVPL